MPENPTQNDERWMALALRQAARAIGRTHPNPPVGCVIVRDGRLVGSGHTQPPPGHHAEIMALREAGEAARGATLYVTLEPCDHHGRTPPCTEAILKAGVTRVVAALRDPHGVAAGGLAVLAGRGVAVDEGVLAGRAECWLRPFLHWARTGRPYVVLKSAMTLDGKTASFTGSSRWISGPVARSYVHRLRRRLGAVMVGVGTAVVDDPLLNVRLEHSGLSAGVQPTRIVVDTRLRLPLTSRLALSARETPLLVACSEGLDESLVGPFRALGAEVVPVPVREGRPDFAILIQELGRRGVTGILLEGGGELAFSALESGSVNEVLTFVAPMILGGREAPSPVGGTGFPEPAAGRPISGLTVRRCGADWLFQGRVD